LLKKTEKEDKFDVEILFKEERDWMVGVVWSRTNAQHQQQQQQLGNKTSQEFLHNCLLISLTKMRINFFDLFDSFYDDWAPKVHTCFAIQC
jgi:hypothetical protein